jgi:hypothetical protein
MIKGENMKNNVVLVLLSLGAWLGSGSANAAWWAPVMTCDNGAATIQVDLGERRGVKIVIADQNIKSYLARIGVSDFDASSYGANDTIQAYVDQGIFNSSQFSGFTRKGVSDLGSGGYAATVKVYREGKGLKLKANQEYGEYCWEQDSGGDCHDLRTVPYRELGDWYFQNCNEIPIVP